MRGVEINARVDEGFVGRQAPLSGDSEQRDEVAAPHVRTSQLEKSEDPRLSGVGAHKGNHENDCESSDKESPLYPVTPSNLGEIGIGARVHWAERHRCDHIRTGTLDQGLAGRGMSRWLFRKAMEFGPRQT